MLLQTKKYIKIKQKLPLIVSSIVVAMGLTLTPQVLAEELIISGNGAESVNEIKTNTSSDTTVQQNNNANVSNEVKVQENTGGNDANNNTGGDTSITTGDASSTTSVTNSGNVSSVNIDNCNGCESGGSVTISGNGAFSDNKVHVHSSSNNTVTINQSAWVKNNVDLELVTGENDANNNVGDVSIRTGNIDSVQNILNALNRAHVGISGGPLHEFLITVLGNGAFSDNDVKLHLNNDNNVFVDNVLSLINDLKERYVTGKNDANNNVGDVDVVTGDITSETNIKNVANISEVKIECECPSPTEAPKPSPTSAPAPTSAPTVAPTQAPTAAPTSAAAAAEEKVLGASAILPVTGNNWLFLAILTNIVMLLMGAYLRLRSGRSPGALI